MFSKRFFLWFLILGILTPALAVVFRPALLEQVLIVEQLVPAPDALVVMAGSRDERLPVAADLYHRGVAPLILLTNDGVFSSWSPEHQRNLYEVEWARVALLELGVPEGAVVLLNFTASGTIHDALNTRDYVCSQPAISEILVVTSDYHTRRVLWSFNQAFAGTSVEIGIYPIPGQTEQAVRRLWVLSTELVKFVYYSLRHGLFI